MEEKPPQLVWDRGVPVWRATRAAIRAGYPVRRVNLSYFADNEAALHARCRRLTAEQNEWLSPQRADPLFDGTFALSSTCGRSIRRARITELKPRPDIPMTYMRA
jgi:hypothetical protein